MLVHSCLVQTVFGLFLLVVCDLPICISSQEQGQQTTIVDLVFRCVRVLCSDACVARIIWLVTC